ncbi:DCC1-like thiol-disulfide oxidoreductase family protein [Caulobacter sp.]|uniref:DCC1-like thiol-disulfide oxidoreductase family protein n=1 Tax=Caulobacter sp. TaxID=78 RepID=UPI002B484F1A|nr:DCC1-like thiol-disulfide oxidoreductase family protein [Caulobacter sp.]HJV43537.1 DCC1-like thiol-disulfide oxidoreductase family protein [Caulobacter sp.]
MANQSALRLWIDANLEPFRRGEPSDVSKAGGGVIVFDGDCAFCTHVVAYLLARLSEPVRLCSCRSAAGAALCGALGVAPRDTFAFVDESGARLGPAAYRAIAARSPRLGGLALALRLSPAWLVDRVYLWIAGHRPLMSRLVGRGKAALPEGRFVERGLHERAQGGRPAEG